MIKLKSIPLILFGSMIISFSTIAMDDSSSDENYSNVDPELEGSTSILDLPPEIMTIIANDLDFNDRLKIIESNRKFAFDPIFITYIEMRLKNRTLEIDLLKLKSEIKEYEEYEKYKKGKESKKGKKNKKGKKSKKSKEEYLINFLKKILPLPEEEPILKIKLKNVKNNSEYFEYFLEHIGPRISSLSFDGLIASEEMQHFFKAAKNGYLINLKKLSLSGDKFGPADVENLSSAIQYMLNLKKLYLPGNNIGPEGVAFIAEAAEKGCLANLETLNLSHNEIGSEDLGILLPSFEFMKLINLDISHNKIGWRGRANALKSCI